MRNVGLFQKCSEFCALAQTGSQFQHGIHAFVNTLTTYLKTARAAISDQATAEESANKIRAYLIQKDRSATPNPQGMQLYNDVSRSIIMFENYFIPGLQQLKANSAKSGMNPEVIQQIINNVNIMVEDLKMVQRGDASQYKPFVVFVGGTVPVDIDKPIASQEQQGPGY